MTHRYFTAAAPPPAGAMWMVRLDAHDLYAYGDDLSEATAAVCDLLTRRVDGRPEPTHLAIYEQTDKTDISTTWTRRYTVQATATLGRWPLDPKPDERQYVALEGWQS